jgi:Xaa-Pro aminopeptidase
MDAPRTGGSGKLVRMIPQARKSRVAAAMRKAGAEAILLTHLPDVRYLTGFTGSSAALVLRGARATLFTDGRYTTQAADEVDGAKIVIVEKNATGAACAALVEAGVTRCAFDTAHTTIDALDALRKGLPAKLRKGWFVPTSNLVAKLREVKDEQEQDAMRQAAALGCRLFEDVLEHVVPAATEMEVAMALEYMARLEGAESMSFDAIIAGGERSALPHGRASMAKLPRRGFVVMDFGVLLKGYCSDMTRTVHMGAARKGEREAYEAVLEAQEAGLAAVRAGVAAGDIDDATRGVLTRHGLADSFTHSTGHGVGMEIHEAPRLAKQATETLRAGMVVTIEPGIYLPGRFGIRIEDTVLITKTGCEILTPATKAWIEL